MGREWLYWVGGGGGGGMGRRRRSVSGEMKVEEDQGTSSPGCMSAVFHLFDSHHFHLPFNQQHSLHPFLQHQHTSIFTSKGVEAPRNSLELEEPASMKAASTPCAIKEDDNLNFPVSISQIKTRRSSCSSEAASDNNIISSPSTKTPNLVARLMGLDLLPHCNSPSSLSLSTSKSPLTSRSHLTHQKTRPNRYFSDDDISVGARSAPRRSDVDHHHRLSLQVNKENVSEEIMKRVGRRSARLKEDENESSNKAAGNYAKQIVKQVKQSVSRRVGLDITNIYRDTDYQLRRDQNLLKPNNKTSSPPPPSSSSPKLRLSDTKKSKAVTDTSSIKSPRNSASSHNCSTTSKPNKHQMIIVQDKESKKVDKGNSWSVKKLRCHEGGMRKKKEEAFVHKSKKTPLLPTSEILHISGPTLLPLKKGPSPPPTKLPQKQSQVSSDALSSKRNTQLSSNTSHSYKQPHYLFARPPNVLPDKTNGCATAASAAPDYRSYIQRILKRAGIIDKFTSLTLGKWHTPSHPLDPSIFYYLELFHPAAAASAVLSRRCNRKLIFHMVDELLAEILRPHMEFRPWVSPIVGNGDQFALDDELCKRIDDFPAANCQVLEDIDCLIDRDFRKSPLNGCCYEEERDSLVCEVEGEIMEWLISETVAIVGVRTEGGGDRSGGCHVGNHVMRCH